MGVGSVNSSSREGRGKQRKGEAGKRMGDDGGGGGGEVREASKGDRAKKKNNKKSKGQMR